MNDLLFIRHAETDSAGTFCGQSDPPVNSVGHEQIASLLESLRTKTFDAIYTSDLLRATTTAAALAALFSIPCIVRPALREIHFGQWEGLKWSEIESLDPAYAKRWIESFPNLPAVAGEAFHAFEARVNTEIDHILTQHDHPRVLVVTHAGVMRRILRTRCNVGEHEAWVRTKFYCCTFRYWPSFENVAAAAR